MLESVWFFSSTYHRHISVNNRSIKSMILWLIAAIALGIILGVWLGKK